MSEMKTETSNARGEWVRTLVEVATGERQHLYHGTCPDGVEGFDSRDPDCPVCQAIDAASALQPPSGGEWVLVPRVPTEAMLDAMHSRIRILCVPAERTADIQNDREVWAAMLAAAPKPTAGETAPVGDGPDWRYAAVSAIEYIDAGDHDEARDMLRSALDLSDEASAPSAPVGEASQAKEWLLELMGDHDFDMPAEAFDELVEALASQQQGGA